MHVPDFKYSQMLIFHHMPANITEPGFLVHKHHNLTHLFLLPVDQPALHPLLILPHPRHVALPPVAGHVLQPVHQPGHQNPRHQNR